MGFLTRDEILNFDDLKHVDVNVPEWGDGTVRVRMMTADERDRWEFLVYISKTGDQEADIKSIRSKLMAFTCVNHESGERLFTEDHIAALGKKSAVAMNRVWAVASSLNKVMAKDVEELAKN